MALWQRGRGRSPNGHDGDGASGIGQVREAEPAYVRDEPRAEAVDYDTPAYLRSKQAASEALSRVDQTPAPGVVRAVLAARTQAEATAPVEFKLEGGWTRQAPTVEGWYGMRVPWRREFPPVIVRVVRRRGHLLLEHSQGRMVRTIPHEWIGPIVLPT